MVWMETYLTYCTVRLGVIIVAVISFIFLFIPAMLFITLGVTILDRLVELFRNDDHYKRQYMIIKGLHWIENHSQNFMTFLNVYLFIHMATALLAIYAALKLNKWCLLPFSVLELFRFIYCLSTHIVLMIILKKVLNLGLLIAVTLVGGFVILYMGYNWATTVALFQIINLVRTPRYKALYGDDPLHPLMPVGNLQRYTGDDDDANDVVDGVIRNVRVLTTPKTNDIDEMKRKQTQPIIAVLPYSRLQYNNNINNSITHNYNAKNNNNDINQYNNNNNNSNNNKYDNLQQQQIEITRWPARAWLQAQRQHPKQQQQQQQQQNRKTIDQYANDKTQYNDSVNYNYWQWNEIFAGGGGGGGGVDGNAKHQLILPTTTHWP